MAKISFYGLDSAKCEPLGLAVRTTMEGESKQTYFSFKRYGKKRALKLAKILCDELTKKQRETSAYRSLEYSRKKYNSDGESLIKVNNINFQLRKGKGPILGYKLQGLDSGLGVSRTSRFDNEYGFIIAYRKCCLKKIDVEVLEYQSEWLEYWESLRPSWSEVKTHFLKRYQYSDWRELV